MTALNWSLENDALYVTSDTLVLTTEGEPRSYMSKLYPVPHLYGVITGTGIGQFIMDWFTMVQNRMLVQCVHHLDRFTSEALRERASEYPLQEASTTIYHFGVSSTEDRFCGFAYRSANDFRSERLDYGVGIKPEIDPGPMDEIQFPDWFVGIMERQREQDLQQPPEQRVGVGGEVHALQVLDDGVMSLFPCHRFDDYDEAFQRMDAALQ